MVEQKIKTNNNKINTLLSKPDLLIDIYLLANPKVKGKLNKLKKKGKPNILPLLRLLKTKAVKRKYKTYIYNPAIREVLLNTSNQLKDS